MSVKRGSFVVLEGVDRVGKTTQAKLIVENLINRGENAVYMRFPDRETEIGKMINAYLSNSNDLDDRAVHLLFSANRWEKLKLILETLSKGTHIICDRYAFSGVCYSSAKKGLSMDWCKVPDAGLPMPDGVIFMSAPEVVNRAGFGEERYESSEFQRTVLERFNELRETGLNQIWNDVPASGTIEEVNAKLMELIDRFINDTPHSGFKKLWDGEPFIAN